MTAILQLCITRALLVLANNECMRERRWVSYQRLDGSWATANTPTGRDRRASYPGTR